MQFFSGRLPLWACDRLFKLLCSPAECWGSACEGLSQLWSAAIKAPRADALLARIVHREIRLTCLSNLFNVRLHKYFPLGFGVTFLVLKIAVKKANVGRPVKSTINSIF